MVIVHQDKRITALEADLIEVSFRTESPARALVRVHGKSGPIVVESQIDPQGLLSQLSTGSVVVVTEVERPHG